nr:hypothetical protein OH820_11950 [Streptomyces sp. NBC_00857]
MPHSPDSHSPLMTVTGHTLVLAQRHAPDKGSTRHGHGRVAVIATAIAVLGSLALLLCLR